MRRVEIIKEYDRWLFDLVYANDWVGAASYDKLLKQLHEVEFLWTFQMDENRAEDGISLRYRFALSNGYGDDSDLVLEYLDRPCSTLEMMVALALRCEEDIMDDASIGYRMPEWFWGMVTNLGLGAMRDELYDEEEVKRVIERFLCREYEANGKGGLFTVKNTEHDLREVEIWHQLLWYLNGIS